MTDKELKFKTLVYIGVPAVSGKVGVEVADFVARAAVMGKAPESPWRFIWQYAKGISPPEAARNCLVRSAIAQKAHVLMMIDDDIRPPHNALKLLNSGADIAAARVVAIAGNLDGPMTLMLTAYTDSGDEFRSIRPDRSAQAEPLVVHAVGFGMVVIKRRVLLDPRMRVDPNYLSADGEPLVLSPDEHAYALFKTPRKPTGERLRSDDLDFCRRARALGYTVSVDMEVGAGQYQTVNLDSVADLVGRAVIAATTGAPRGGQNAERENKQDGRIEG